MAFAYGFRILGPLSGQRRGVDMASALLGYAACDPRVQVGCEGYLSAFTFGEDFRELLETTGSIKGFAGACDSPYLWWDIDREGDLEAALRDTSRLSHSLAERFDLDGQDLLVFYSGSKGFHLGLPTALWAPEPSAVFNRVARRFAEELAASAGVTIDSGVYDKARAFRAPNSRHPKTGRYKRRLTREELTGLSLSEILALAKQPALFDFPAPRGQNTRATADWQAAMQRVEKESEAQERRRAVTQGAPTLNRATLDFIRIGAPAGNRHRLLFSAAANLAEFDCPPALAHALLTEAGRDCGLAPAEVYRQIECGLDHVQRSLTNG